MPSVLKVQTHSLAVVAPPALPNAARQKNVRRGGVKSFV